MFPILSVCAKCPRKIDLTAVPVGELFGCCAKDDRDGEIFRSCYLSIKDNFTIPANCDYKKQHECTPNYGNQSECP